MLEWNIKSPELSARPINVKTILPVEAQGYATMIPPVVEAAEKVLEEIREELQQIGREKPPMLEGAARREWLANTGPLPDDLGVGAGDREEYAKRYGISIVNPATLKARAKAAGLDPAFCRVGVDGRTLSFDWAGRKEALEQRAAHIRELLTVFEDDFSDWIGKREGAYRKNASQLTEADLPYIEKQHAPYALLGRELGRSTEDARKRVEGGDERAEAQLRGLKTSRTWEADMQALHEAGIGRLGLPPMPVVGDPSQLGEKLAGQIATYLERAGGRGPDLGV